MPIRVLKDFSKLEASSGIILFFSMILAIIWANSPLAYLHHAFIDASLFIINEGLMTLFFVIVGLELKRGFLTGELTKLSQVALPIGAGIGGMVVPALIYYLINHADHLTLRGWAIPVATDIAFALAVLTFFGKRIPKSLKLFLLTLAIFDDLGAILIIVFFYVNQISAVYLILSAIVTSALFLMNYASVKQFPPYLMMGLILWYCLLKAGIHPTLGGVIFALALPGNPSDLGLVKQVEDSLHPFVAFLIMPLFALANAGISLADITVNHLTNRVTLGIILGLVIGKQMGVMLASFLMIRLGNAALPAKASWCQLYGVALLCGIGFTMSLFLGTLSFANHTSYLADVRLGVLLGSLLSGLLGGVVLTYSSR